MTSPRYPATRPFVMVGWERARIVSERGGRGDLVTLAAALCALVLAAALVLL